MATRILETAGFDSADLDDIFGVLESQGACCDCEILYNHPNGVASKILS
jgi:hypothetical protein